MEGRGVVDESNESGKEHVMSRKNGYFLALVGWLVILETGICADGFCQDAGKMSIVNDTRITGFVNPESVAYDPFSKVLYVSQFGSVLKPTLKDGKGRVSKVALTGEIIEERFLPAPGEVLNKPKGIWVDGTRLWVTDIDVVWVFDLKSRQGRKAVLPGAKFANDPAVIDNILFVSDSEGRQIYRVAPADFLENKGEPSVTVWSADLSFGPNGLYPARDGSLLVVGYDMAGSRDQGIYSVDSSGKAKALSPDLGRLDGLAQQHDGSLLVTDWKSKSLFKWSPDIGKKTLVTGFQGPADFCVIPEDHGILVVVPDLVTSELRLIRFSR
jgi:hypothetical protein